MRKTGDITHVPCSASIDYCNKYMGGVDLAYNHRRTCSFSLKTMRWYMRIFGYLVESAAVNAHILKIVTSGEKSSQISFRKTLAFDLLTKFDARQRPGSVDNYRWTFQRWPLYGGKTKDRGICFSSKCNKRTRYTCKQCEYHSCLVPYFQDWHLR